MMNGEEYAQLKREAYRTTNSAAPDQYMDDALIFNAEELEYLEKGYWVDWQDLLLGTGITQNYEISMSGGTEKTSYSLSFGFQDDKGLLKNDVLKRYNGRISLDHKINKIFNVGVNVSYTFKDQDKRQNPLNLANKIPCIGRAYDDNGNFILNPAPGNSSAFSPLCDEQPGAYEDNIRTKRMFASGYLNVNILKDFFFKSTIGIDVTDSREGIYKDKNTVANLGVKSTSSVHAHLETLEKNGYIRRDPTKPRAIEIVDENFNLTRREMVNVPIVGRVAAGEPILAVENIENYFPIPAEFMPNEQTFILQVQGESMVNAGILDGDYILVEQQTTANDGDMVVALVDDSATVKTFYKENGYYRLQPENDFMEPIIVSDVMIMGKVIGTFRFFK